jgi:hypothetical protein
MTPGGQARHSDLAIKTALTFRAVFRLALRQSEGLIGVIGGAQRSQSNAQRNIEVTSPPKAHKRMRQFGQASLVRLA